MSTKGNVADKAKLFAEKSKLDTIYCERCNKNVLKSAPDHLVFENHVYHVNEFKCCICKTQLKLSNAVRYKNDLFCQTHNPSRDHNRLSHDTEKNHRQRSGSVTNDQEYQAIRVKKDHKQLPLPTTWVTNMKSISNLSAVPNEVKISTNLSNLSRDMEIKKSMNGLSLSPTDDDVHRSNMVFMGSRQINLDIKIEYEEIKKSYEKLEENTRKRGYTLEDKRSRSQSLNKEDDYSRRRVQTVDIPSSQLRNQSTDFKVDQPKDYFIELPDFWYELDATYSKPKTNKLPILVMGDEEINRREFGRENLRHFTKLGISPYMNYDMEWVDVLCLYYRHFIKQLDHTNYVALIDEGPVLITVYMEKGESSSDEESLQDLAGFMDALKDNKYKILMRWKGGLDWRLVFYESEFRNKTGIKSAVNRRKIISYLHPSLIPTKLIKITDPNIKDEICKLDELRVTTEYKFGVIVVKKDQFKEEEIFANKDSDEHYDELLGIVGHKIELLGFQGHCGGLDNKNGRTGIHSVHTKFSDFEIMYHVSTMLPFDPVDPQQIQRKRHIGNDIVCLVYLEEGAKFNPSMIASKFLHVYICVQKVANGWKVVIAANKHIPYFGPALPNPNIFTDKETLRGFLLTKCISHLFSNQWRKCCISFDCI
eukprot:NODE_75_length_23955_cov_0.435069.p1 type:complete len:649 gc:universal NODE_75_length_23955_cov_0.435069:21733-23679(+)